MKKILLFMATMPLLAGAVDNTTNQLPDAGFQSQWVDCIPWTSAGNTAAYGTQPADWKISNVSGMSGLGNTIVGSMVDGYESTQAVCLTNKANSIMATQIVPGYLTLGTPWNTSVMGSKNDGGTFGGISFTGRPDALTYMYKREYGTPAADASESVKATYKDDEPFTTVAYTWIGSTTQKDVPGNIVAFGNPKKVDMVDRDRNILGMTTYFGGEITRTGDFQLVCSVIDSLVGAKADWTRRTLPLTYTAKNLVPEKINVVFCSGRYFENALGRDNSLTVDDVRLLYYSQLSEITIAGEPLPGFAPDVYDYAYTGDGDVDDMIFDLEYKVKGYAAKANMNAIDNVVTINVTNPDGTDLDGVNTHKYTITLTSGIEGLHADDNAPVIYYNLQGQKIANPQAGQIVIRRKGSKAVKTVM